jgi:hypothetical protein
MPNEEIDLERERWKAELPLRQREVALKEEKHKLKKDKHNQSGFRDPLVLAILAAAIAALGNLVATLYTGYSQRQLESDKAKYANAAEDDKFKKSLSVEETKSEAARILEVIKTHPDKAAENLEFLVETALIGDARREPIIRYLSKTKTWRGSFAAGYRHSTRSLRSSSFQAARQCYYVRSWQSYRVSFCSG